MWLLHGTTLARAERIVRSGPDVNFVEPGGGRVAENVTFTAGRGPVRPRRRGRVRARESRDIPGGARAGGRRG